MTGTIKAKVLTIKVKVLTMVLLMASLAAGQSAWATTKTVTYKITSADRNLNSMNWDIVFTRSGDAPFDTSAPTTYTVSVSKGSIENDQSGYVSVMLADGFQLNLQWDANSDVKFINNCIYPNAGGKYITYSVSHYETYHYVTHVFMTGANSNYKSGLQQPYPHYNEPIDYDYDSVWDFHQSYQSRYAFGQLTISYTDVPLLSIFEAAGTNTYNIKTKHDLGHLAAYVNNGHNDCNGLSFLQTNNIAFDTITANNYTPIGCAVKLNGEKQSYWFDGTYDGQGRTISGIYVNRTDSDQYPNSYVGLFGYTNEHGVIKNIVLTGSTFVGKDYVGGIVGYNEGSSNKKCLVTNCRVGNDVIIKAGTNKAYRHGGIVGRNEGIVQGCLSGASVSKNGKSGCMYYGGIVGDNISTIRDCFYTGNLVTADTLAGAIIGSLLGHNINNNYYTADGIGGVNGNDVSGACRGYKVSLGNNVTLKNPTESVYDLSGLTNIRYVLNYTNYYVLRYENDIYCEAGQPISLSYTGTIPVGKDVVYHSTAGTITGNVLTMPEQDVTVTATLAYMYMDANGKTHTTNATSLYSSQNIFPGGTYYVGANLTFNNNLSFDGDVTLILGNGTMMDITTSHSDPGLYVKGNLTVYGQSLDAATAGTLRILGTSGYMSVDSAYTQHSGNVIINNVSHRGLKAGSMTLNGGKLRVLVSGANGNSVECQQDITINGGILNSTGNSSGLYSQSGHITLGWTRTTDRITATNYYSMYPVVTKTSQSFFNDPDTPDMVMDTVTEPETINGKTLIPSLVIFDDDSAQPDGWKNQDLMYQARGKTLPVMLKGRTLYKDGKWNTLCLPFTLLIDSIPATPLAGDGVTVRRFDKESHLNGSVLTLRFLENATYPANEPFIIRWDSTGASLTDPVFKGVSIMINNGDVTSNDKHVKFKGTYTPISFTEANQNVLIVGPNNHIYYPQSGAVINSCRGYFVLSGASQAPSRIILNTDEENNATDFGNVEHEDRTDKFLRAGQLFIRKDGMVYDVLGRRVRESHTNHILIAY